MIVNFRHRASTVRVLGITTALVISGIAVSQASYSAFTTQTSNAGNSWSTAESVFTNDHATGFFEVANADRGKSYDDHIDFKYAGPTDHTKDLYVYTQKASGVDSDLAKNTTINVIVPDPDSSNGQKSVYDGSLSDFLSKNSYDTGVLIDTGTDPVADITRTSYHNVTIQFKINDSAPDTAMGETIKTDLVFEMKDTVS